MVRRREGTGALIMLGAIRLPPAKSAHWNGTDFSAGRHYSLITLETCGLAAARKIFGPSV